MTQHDNLLQEVARLTQRQDQLERQQGETATRADYLKRDVDTLRSDVNRRIDYLHRDMDSRFRDGERRVNSLERPRDNSLDVWIYLPLVVALVFLIIVVTAAIASREQRQEPGEPEQRSPSSFHAPPPSSGGHLQPGIAVAGALYLKHHPTPTNHGPSVPGR